MSKIKPTLPLRKLVPSNVSLPSVMHATNRSVIGGKPSGRMMQINPRPAAKTMGNNPAGLRQS